MVLRQPSRRASLIRSSHKREGKAPKISVITVCCNSQLTIAHTIDSVNTQTYSNVEHVFVDGLSSDQTMEIIREKSTRNKLVLSESDEGIYDALNKGLTLATGDVIGFLHADDFFAHAGVLDLIAKTFISSDVTGVYGDLHYVSQSDPDQIVRRWETKPFTMGRLKRGWMPPHPTLYLVKSWYNRIGGFDTGYKISADYFFMLKLFGSPEFCAHYIPETLVKMRAGGESNRSLKNILLKSREDLDALKRTDVGGIPTLLMKNLRKLTQFREA